MALRLVIPAEVDLRNLDDRKRIAKSLKADPEIVFPIRIHIASNSYVEAEGLEEARTMIRMLLEQDEHGAAEKPPTDMPAMALKA